MNMKIKILLSLLIMQICVYGAYSQVTPFEVYPSFPGGTEAMVDYISKTYEYPESFSGDRITGKCYVELTIDADGSLSAVNIRKGIDKAVDEELVRVFKSMPKWNPGTLRNEPLKGNMIFPITLDIPRPSKPVVAAQQEENNVVNQQDAIENVEVMPQSTDDFLANWKKQYYHTKDEYPVSPNAKTVYINNYKTDYQFTDGMLAIQNTETGKWGFIDENGNLLQGGYKWLYIDYQQPRFGGGYCLVALKRNPNLRELDWYILDKKGNAKRLNASGRISNVSCFNEDGIVAVMVEVGYNGQIKYFKADGTEVYKTISASAPTAMAVVPLGSFIDGRALFYNAGKNVYGFINKSGNIVANKTFRKAQNFSEGLAAVEINTDLGRRWGYIDVNGTLAIPAKFSKEPSPFVCGYAVAEKQNGKKVFINKQGEPCSAEYDRLTNFVNGYALASISTKCYIIDTDMKVRQATAGGFDHSTLREMEKDVPLRTVFDGKYIIYDGSYMSDGLIWPQTGYKYGVGNGPFSENRVHVVVDRGVHQGDDHYFLDRTGQVVIKFAKEEF